jgi:hypothetical protein
MKNLLWLMKIYPSYTSRWILVLEYLFDRKAHRSRLAIEQRFASVLARHWSQV